MMIRIGVPAVVHAGAIFEIGVEAQRDREVAEPVELSSPFEGFELTAMVEGRLVALELWTGAKEPRSRGAYQPSLYLTRRLTDDAPVRLRVPYLFPAASAPQRARVAEVNLRVRAVALNSSLRWESSLVKNAESSPVQLRIEPPGWQRWRYRVRGRLRATDLGPASPASGLLHRFSVECKPEDVHEVLVDLPIGARALEVQGVASAVDGMRSSGGGGSGPPMAIDEGPIEMTFHRMPPMYAVTRLYYYLPEHGNKWTLAWCEEAPIDVVNWR